MDDDNGDNDENGRLLSKMDDDEIVKDKTPLLKMDEDEIVKDKTPLINVLSIRIVFFLTLTIMILIGSNRCNAKHDKQNYDLIEYIAQILKTISIDLPTTKYFGSVYK